MWPLTVSASWLIVADSRFFYLFVNPWVAAPANGRLPYFFGDFISFKPGDMKCWCISRNGLASFNGGGDLDGYVFSTSNTAMTIDQARAAVYLPDSQSSPTSAALAHLVGGIRGVFPAQYQLLHQRKPGALRADHGRGEAA